MRQTDAFEAVLLVVMCVAVSLVAAYYVFLPRVEGPREAGPRATCINNMRQLALALRNYHDDHGSLPPAYTVDDDGRRLHSWRTLILPYLDRNDVYQSLHLDEPWDSPHNREFAKLGMSVMSCPSDGSVNDVAPQMTPYLAIVGPETAFPDGDSVSLDDITDDPTKTLLIVEVADSGILWMEPRDLDVAQMAPTVNATTGHGIRSEHSGGAVVVFVDGHIEFLSEPTTAEELAAMLTIAGGE